jgi:replicative DNA helicase
MPDDKKKQQEARTAADVQRDIEYNLIGCLLYRPGFYDQVAGRLKPEYFQFDAHRNTFIEIERRAAAGLSIDPYSVLQGLPDDLLTDDGLRLHDYLIKSGTSATLVLSVGQVEALRLRYTLAAADNAAKVLSTGAAPDLVLQQFFSAVDDLRFDYQQTNRETDVMPIGVAVHDFTDDFNKRLAGKVVDQRVRTGLAALDNMVGGFGEGDLVIIAGRPGMGKSTLATSIVRAAALPKEDVDGKIIKPAYPGLLFSFEMVRRQVVARMMAEDIAHTVELEQKTQGIYGPEGLEYRALINPLGSLEYNEWDRKRPEWNGVNLWAYVDEADRRFENLPIDIDCSSSLPIGELAARARKAAVNREKKGQRLSLVVIDYIKQIKASDRYKGNRVLEVGEITYSLKMLAKELAIPVILLCQLNRAVENRQDKRPILADLRESGDIEQDADVVMFTYRRHYYDKTVATKNDFEVLIEKNRNGPLGTVSLYCDMGRSYIRDR